MKNIVAINVIYLTTVYSGSGFFTYLYELLNALNRLKNNNKCEYWLYTSESNSTLEDLVETSQGGFKLMVVKPSGRGHFANDIVRHHSLVAPTNNKVKVLFLPHLELARWNNIPRNLKIVPLIHDIIPTLFLTPSFVFSGKTPLSMFTRRGIKDYLLIKWSLSWWVKKNFPYLLTISETSKQSLLTVFGKRWLDKISIISPGKSSEFIKTKKFSKHAFDGEYLKWNKYMVYFGGYTVRKNVSRLLDGFQRVTKRKEFNNLQLVLVGARGKSFFEKKVGKIKGLVLISKLPSEELNLLLSGACLSAYPSLYEGFGLPLIESIQAGTLSLASDIPSSREILPDTYPLFDPYSVNDLEEKLVVFLKEVYLRENTSFKKMWLSQLTEKIQKYSWDKSAKRLDDLFASW